VDAWVKFDKTHSNFIKGGDEGTINLLGSAIGFVDPTWLGYRKGRQVIAAVLGAFSQRAHARGWNIIVAETPPRFTRVKKR